MASALPIIEIGERVALPAATGRPSPRLEANPPYLTILYNEDGLRTRQQRAASELLASASRAVCLFSIAMPSATECASDSASSLFCACGAQRTSPRGTWSAATRRRTTCCTWLRCTPSGAAARRRASRRMRHALAPGLRHLVDRLRPTSVPEHARPRSLAQTRRARARTLLRAPKRESSARASFARRYKTLVEQYIEQQKKVSSAPHAALAHAEVATY